MLLHKPKHASCSLFLFACVDECTYLQGGDCYYNYNEIQEKSLFDLIRVMYERKKERKHIETHS